MSEIDERIYIAVLLGGEAGLRRGEILALEWNDIDLKRSQMNIQRSEWNGHLTSTKGNRSRHIPLTKRLNQALLTHRHLRGPRVLYRDNGKAVSAKYLQRWIQKAQRKARLQDLGLKETGGVHVLRHTFCSHLAMRGAPAKAIQELAGHRQLSTTMRYMHLSPTAVRNAIDLLESNDQNEKVFGDIMETGTCDNASAR